MRALEINRLACEHSHGLAVVSGQRVVGQVHVEGERRNLLEEAPLVEIREGGQRRNITRALDACRAQPPLIDDWNIERLEQGARVLTEALLSRDERVAVMLVFDLALP